MRQIRMFEQLANKGFGGFIRLKSWNPNEHGDHKRPVGNDWTNPENWFKTFEEASQGEKYGVGFALKDLIVLDVDEPVEGFDPEVYETPYGITPSGGYHILFRKPNGSNLRGATCLLLPGVGKVDIRTDGNQIAITPTLYKWFVHDKIKTLPQGLAHQLEVATGVAGQSVKEVFKRFANGEVFGEGERNTTLYRLAIGFLSLYRSLKGEDPDDEQWEALCEWLNEEAVEEPEENFAKYYHRYLRYNTDDFRLQRFLTSERVRYGLQLMGVQVSAEPVKQHVNSQAELTSPVLKLTGLEVMQYAEKIDWVVDGVLPQGSVALLSAQPSVGKSTFLRQLAVCVANGVPFLGVRTRQTKVVYYTNDEHPTFIGMHLRQLSAKADVSGVEFWVGNFTLDQFVSEVSKLRDAVVIVDVLGRWIDDLKDYAIASKVMGTLRQLSVSQNITLILAHHAPRSENRALGVAAIDGAVDVEFRLYREGGQRFLDIDKRTMKKAFGLPLKLTDGWLEVDRKENAELLKLIEEVFEGTQDDFLWLDKVPAEYMPALNLLIAKGYIRLKVSQKSGNPYIQLRNLNLQDIKRRILESDQQYAQLIAPTQKEVEYESDTRLLGSGRGHTETDGAGESRPDVIDGFGDAEPELGGLDLSFEDEAFEAEYTEYPESADELVVGDDGEWYAGDETLSVYDHTPTEFVGDEDEPAGGDIMGTSDTRVDWLNDALELVRDYIQQQLGECAEEMFSVYTPQDADRDWDLLMGDRPENADQMLQRMDEWFDAVESRQLRGVYRHLRRMYLKWLRAVVLHKATGRVVNITPSPLSYEQKVAFLWFWTLWFWVDHSNNNGVRVRNFHQFVKEVLNA
ncbi:MAG: AAA family ATPase [Candidatus Caldarchaeum sp.]